MNPMVAKIHTIYPEILLTATAFLVMLLGLSPSNAIRRSTGMISLVALVVAALLAEFSGGTAGLVFPIATFAKIAIAGVGAALMLVVFELPDEAGDDPKAGQPFDAANTSRGEVFGFLLLSLVGAMLCAGADDLIWLFLALELTSLPTYVLVATSRQNIKAPEAGVKYFFLGAFAAAIFLYGFALIYTATGTTDLHQIHDIIAQQGLTPLALTGMVLAVVGIAFKIAAVPMHSYVADVYQGAATPITTFLAFTPKIAGFLSLILLLSAVGWPLEAQTYVHHMVNAPDQVLGTGAALSALLWILAAATMIIGNTLALMQDNVKRVLAYSSVAHTGYMLVGLVAGPGPGSMQSGSFIRNGVAAVLFYIVAYGVMNLGAFAVLGILKNQGEEAETFEDLHGLASRRPALAAIMAICILSLTGIPPLIGFWGKLFIFGSAISAGYVVLTIIGVVNSAIGAYYYLRIIGSCYLHESTNASQAGNLPSRSFAAGVSAVVVVLLSIGTGPLVYACHDAVLNYVSQPVRSMPVQAPAAPAAQASAVPVR
jgi:NADH-quinone oxidoreductase subunit N